MWSVIPGGQGCRSYRLGSTCMLCFFIYAALHPTLLKSHYCIHSYGYTTTLGNSNRSRRPVGSLEPNIGHERHQVTDFGICHPTFATKPTASYAVFFWPRLMVVVLLRYTARPTNSSKRTTMFAACQLDTCINLQRTKCTLTPMKVANVSSVDQTRCTMPATKACTTSNAALKTP